MPAHDKLIVPFFHTTVWLPVGQKENLHLMHIGMKVAEIKNRVGPSAAAQPGPDGLVIDSKSVEANKAGGCC